MDNSDAEPRLQAEHEPPCPKASYDVRVRERDGRFIAAIPELGLLESGKTLAEAYERLDQVKDRKIREYAAEGVLDWLPKNAEPAAANQPGLLRRLTPFLIKAAIVCGILFWSFGMLNDSTRDIGYGLEKKLQSLAAMPPEDVEKNRQRAAAIAKNLRPIMRELLVVFRDPQPPAAPDQPAAVGVSPSQGAPAPDAGNPGRADRPAK